MIASAGAAPEGAVATAALASCIDKADPPVRGPRLSGVYFLVSGKAYNTCPVSPQVTYMEVYASLERLINGGWQNLATQRNTRAGGGAITAIGAYTRCNHNGTYVYRTNELAYAVFNGIGYTDVHQPSSNIRCA